MAPYSSPRPGGQPPSILVVHTGEGILDRFGMVRFLDNNPRASTHVATDAGGVEPSVPDERAAWTAGPTANSKGLHNELCTFAAMTRAHWLSESDVDVWVPWLGAWRRIKSPMSMLRHAAAWARAKCDRYGIPKRWVTAAELRAGARGITDHDECSRAWGETNHTDAGDGFPADVFIRLVLQEEDDDMTPEQAKKLDEAHRLTQLIYSQLVGSKPDGSPADPDTFPGWPLYNVDGSPYVENGKQVRLTLVDILRRVFTKTARPFARGDSTTDDLLGHVTTAHAEVRGLRKLVETIKTKVGA